jgi:DNA-binding XRE family transcriptional regulator/cell division protein FtsB
MTLNNKEYIKSEITRLFLSGYSQEKISGELNVSEGTISSIVNEIIKSDDSIPLQRQIAVIVNKNGIDLKEVAANIRWKNRVKLMSLDEEKIEKLLYMMELLFKKNEIDPQTAADCIYAISVVMLKNDIQPDRLKEEVESKNEELLATNEKIKEKKKLLEDSNTKIDNMLIKNNLKEENINLFLEISQVLELYGLDRREFFKLGRAIKDFKNLGWDVNYIISQYEEFESLKNTKNKLEKKIQKYELVVEKYRRKQREEESRWSIHNHAFNIFSNLIEAGLRPEDIFKICLILKDDFSENLISELIEDIQTYGSISSARIKLERENEKSNMIKI